MAYHKHILTGFQGAVIALFGWNLGRLAAGIHDSLHWTGSMSPTAGVVGTLAWRPDLWFHPVDVPPFFPTTYPPVSPAIIHAAWRLVGGDLYVVGRMVGFSAILITAILIALLVFYWTNSPYAAAVGGGLYLFSPVVAPPVVHMRVDYVAIMFGVAALYVFERRKHRRHLAVAILLAVLAAWTKQSMIMPGVAIVLVLAIRREYEAAAASGAAYTATGVGALLVVTGLTGGRAWQHLVVNHSALPWHAARVVAQLDYFITVHKWIVALGLLSGVLYLKRERRWLIPIYTAVAIEMAFITVGRQGAWAGYFVPALAGFAILAGWAVANSDGWLHLAITALVILQLGGYATAVVPGAYDHDAQMATIETLEERHNPVLVEAPGMLYTAGHRQEPYETIQMRYLGETEHWDPDLLANRIHDREYSMIVTRVNVSNRDAWADAKWPPEVLGAIDEHYELVERNKAFHVYEPARP